MAKQLIHNEFKAKSNAKEIIVVGDEIRTPENVGMILRVSEGFGVKKVVFIGDSPNLSNRKVLRTARSTDKNLEINFIDNSMELLKKLRNNNYKLIGLELADNSKSLQDFDFKNYPKIAIFIGNERNGISNELLKKLDVILQFDLFGKNSSINVVNALSIGLYQATL